MKSFIVTLLVSCSFVSFSAYGGRSDEEGRVIVIHKNDKLTTPREDQQDTFQLFQLPCDIHQIIINFMSSEAQHFALTSKKSHELVIRNRMNVDPRKLQNIPFVDGPFQGTPESYRFNAAVRHALKQMIILKEDRASDEQLLTQAEPILKVSVFLNMVFPQYPATNRVSKFLSAGDAFFKNRNTPFVMFPELAALAEDKEHVAERELMRHFSYLTLQNYNPTLGYYADTEMNPAQMGLVKRHYLTLQKRAAVQSPEPIGVGESELQVWRKKKEADWDFIIRYGVVLTSNDYSIATNLHYEAKNYERTAQLCEEILSKYPNEVTADDFRLSIFFHYKAKNYVRELELRDEILSKYPNEVKANDFRNAAAAHFGAKNYERAAQLREDVLSKYPNEVKVIDFINAAAAHYKAKNYERAAQLCEDALSKYPAEVVVNDFRKAAAAHFGAQNYERAAQLREDVLSKYPNEVKADDFRNAATAHFDAKNYERAAQLREDVLSKYPNEVTTDDFRVAIFVHYKAKNYERAAQLCEDILSKYPAEMVVNDFRKAASAHFLAQHFDRAAEFLSAVSELGNASPSDRVSFFISLHSNLKKHDEKINTLLEGDLLKDNEKTTYLSLFKKGSQEEIIHAIEDYVSTPGNEDPGASLLKKIIYQIGFMIHAQAGNTVKAEEFKQKLKW